MTMAWQVAEEDEDDEEDDEEDEEEGGFPLDLEEPPKSLRCA